MLGTKDIATWLARSVGLGALTVLACAEPAPSVTENATEHAAEAPQRAAPISPREAAAAVVEPEGEPGPEAREEPRALVDLGEHDGVGLIHADARATR